MQSTNSNTSDSCCITPLLWMSQHKTKKGIGSSDGGGKEGHDLQCNLFCAIEGWFNIKLVWCRVNVKVSSVDGCELAKGGWSGILYTNFFFVK